ncbi:transcription factor UPBEAT1 [Prunus yedoensis var. nudiflora]|uniref:Transcription factor UPBEAT1 n=1 Tax=Prunus yedoensis var. nudiflora TaxID=2094558 RepID=A0A314YEL7_PRUYE|nr:transcription factor UPBEAT1 [Prunus yedoensis var. nudiflora]
MGSQHPLLVSLDLKGMVLKNEGKSYTKWNKVNMITRTPKRRRILKKRGTGRRLQGARRRCNGIQRRVKILKRLIPNTDSSTGLDGLFSETADYILSLQSRVRLLQIMVQALAPASHHDE